MEYRRNKVRLLQQQVHQGLVSLGRREERVGGMDGVSGFYSNGWVGVVEVFIDWLGVPLCRETVGFLCFAGVGHCIYFILYLDHSGQF